MVKIPKGTGPAPSGGTFLFKEPGSPIRRSMKFPQNAQMKTRRNSQKKSFSANFCALSARSAGNKNDEPFYSQESRRLAGTSIYMNVVII